MSRLVCIDPGFDGTGVAIFRVRPCASLLVGTALPHLRHVETIATPTEMRFAPRLAALQGRLEGVLRREFDNMVHSELELEDQLTVLVEEPAIANVYREREGRQHGVRPLNAVSMSKFWSAYGVVAATVAAYPHSFVRARMKKEEKRAIVAAAVMRFPAREGVLPLVRKLNQDEVDAIALGLLWDGWRTV